MQIISHLPSDPEKKKELLRFLYRFLQDHGPASAPVPKKKRAKKRRSSPAD